MARNDKLLVLRTIRANLNTQASGNNLFPGEIYYITDENRLAVGMTTSTYKDLAKRDVTDLLFASTSRIAGRITAGAGAGEELTGAQVTSLLSLFNSSAQGVVASPGTATKKYLRDDGSWYQDVRVIQFVIDGGGAAISTGIKGDLYIPFACVINEWTLLADQSGSIVIDIWKDTYANYPPTIADTIVASAKPTISSANKGQSSTLTGWTTSIAAGSILRFNVDSAATIQRATLALKVTVD